MVLSSFYPIRVLRSFRAAATFVVALVFFLIFFIRICSLSHARFSHASKNASCHTCPPKISETDFSPTAIRCRIQSAQTKAQSAHKAQSSTPEEAVVEYERRYHRPPPKGFKEWAQFALGHGSKIIDDFDQIDRDLQPYRTTEARRVFKLLNEQGQDLPYTTRITFQNGVMSTSTGYMYDDGLSRVVQPFVHALPNSTFYLSTIDEARILSCSGPPPDSIQFKDRPGESIEELIVDSCAQIPRDLTSRLGHDKDVCQFSHPADLHAFIASPSTFSYTHSLVPILSFGRMSAFRDILIPCPCYTRHPIIDQDSLSFFEKQPALYWRGLSTGGRATRFTWKTGHRERFVAFVQSLQNAANIIDTSRFLGLKVDSLVSKQLSVLKGVFDVQMGGYIQCDEETCKDMERILGPPDREPEDTSSDYRYLFDIDGNSMSTRFYRLLSRKAVVLKQTLFQEWHDDRLIPWAHYIPVTMGLQELPALISFLITDPDGELLSATIAHSGSTWAREALREIDMSIYVYRLLLEMAELYGLNDVADGGQ